MEAQKCSHSDFIAMVKNMVSKAGSKKPIDPKGTKFMLNCAINPKHNDKNPSMMVTFNNGSPRARCFSCGVSKSGKNLMEEFGSSVADTTEELRPEGIYRTYIDIEKHRKSSISGSDVRRVEYYYFNKNKELARTVPRMEDLATGKKIRKGSFHAKGSPPCIPWRAEDLDVADYVILVEGEKCAEDCCLLGINATTFPGGSQSIHNFGDVDNLFKLGQKVFLWPDNDEAGATWTKELGDRFRRRLFKISDPQNGRAGDVSDTIWRLKSQGKSEDEIADFIIHLASNATLYVESGPRPFAVGLPSVPKFPVEALPSAFKNWIISKSEAMGTPVDYLAISTFVCIAAILGSRVRMKPDYNGEYTLATNLWGLSVGSPSSRKSSPTSLPVKFLKKINNDLGMSFAQKAAEYKEALLLYKKQQKKEGVIDPEFSSEPEQPVQRRLVVEDTTPPSAQMAMEGSDGRFLIFQDEIFSMLERFSDELGFLNTAFDGNSSYEVLRTSTSNRIIKHCSACVLGTAQPDVLTTILDQDEEKHVGFVPRLQMVVWPDPLENVKIMSEKEDEDQNDSMFRIFEIIYKMDPSKIGAREISRMEDGSSFYYCWFSNEAQELFNRWKLFNFERSRDPSLTQTSSSYVLKLEGLIPKLAMIINVIDEQRAEVSLRSLHKAIVITDYLEKHFHRWSKYRDVKRNPLTQIAIAMKSGSFKDSDISSADLLELKIKGALEPRQASDLLRQMQEKGWLEPTIKDRFSVHPEVHRKEWRELFIGNMGDVNKVPSFFDTGFKCEIPTGEMPAHTTSFNHLIENYVEDFAQFSGQSGITGYNFDAHGTASSETGDDEEDFF